MLWAEKVILGFSSSLRVWDCLTNCLENLYFCIFIYDHLWKHMEYMLWKPSLIIHPFSTTHNKKRVGLYTHLSWCLLWNPHYIHVWSSELERDIRGASLDWEKIWTSFIYASKHLNYQWLNLNSNHRIYLPPGKSFLVNFWHLQSAACAYTYA